MARPRTTNPGVPPYLHRKGRTWYYVAGTEPRKWTRLSTSLDVTIDLGREIERSKAHPLQEIDALRAIVKLMRQSLDRADRNLEGSVILTYGTTHKIRRLLAALDASTMG